MHAEGLVVPTYQFRDRRDGLIAEFDFGLLTEETVSSTGAVVCPTSGAGAGPVPPAELTPVRGR